MRHRFFHFIRLALLANIALGITSCSDDDGGNKKQGTQSYRRSVLFYLAAQNSLGDAGAATLDSMEIAAGASMLTDNNDNVFLFIDDEQKPRLYRYYKAGRGKAQKTYYQKVMAWSYDANSSDPATLREILKFIALNYQSQSYGLVMWSHGDGWLPSSNVVNTLDDQPAQSHAFSTSTPMSIGVDVGTDGDMEDDTDVNGKLGPQMDIADMATAIRQSGVHLDYIFFDACHMQCIEVAYELKDVADYIVGSAIATSAYGAYYVNQLPNALFAYPISDENATLIASQYYYDAMENETTKAFYGSNGMAISTIKTAELSNLASITGYYIKKYITNRQSPNMGDTQYYSYYQGINSPNFFDMGSAMHHLLSADDYQQWKAQADKCVIYHKVSQSYRLAIYYNQDIMSTLTDPDNVLAVSMFIPQDIFNSSPYHPFNNYFKSTAWYADASWNETGW